MSKSRILVSLTLAIALLLPHLAYSLDTINAGPSNDEVPLYPTIETHSTTARKILILNSYYETSPIQNKLIEPILTQVARDPNLSCEIYYLNAQLISDSTVYQSVRDNFFRNYRGKAPDYVVIHGKPGFNLRADIKEHWGDVPILLICQSDRYASLDYYFSGVNYPKYEDRTEPLANLREEYNFTAVFWSDHYRQNVDLIMRLRPETRTLIFASDESFLSRNTSANIYDYLLEEYPGVGFRWLNANRLNAVEFQKLMGESNPTSSVLLSSWSYGKISEKGFPLLSTTELNLVSASRTPIFSIYQQYMDYGAVGGVFSDTEELQREIADVFDKMLAGESMRKIPFYYNNENYETVLNYELLKQYKIPLKNCPSDTVYIERPAQFWEKYHWEIIGVGLAILMVAFILWKRMANQQTKIQQLNRHKEFITNMPVAFTKVDVIYDENGNAVDVQSPMMNEAFAKLIEENKIDEQDHIFPQDFINERIKELNTTRDSIRFTYRFPRTGHYFEFIASFINKTVSKNAKIREIDFFALDLTEHMEMENKMKELTRQLDVTINVAGIIPWYWNLKTDELTLDAYNIFTREELKFNEGSERHQITVNEAGTEYFALIHPDDAKIIRTLRENLFNKNCSDFRARYRLRHAIDGKEKYQWVEIRGRVTHYDRLKNPELVSGAMWRLNDEDVTQDKAHIYE